MNSIIIFCAKYLIYIVAVGALIYWLTLPGRQKIRFLIFGAITGIVAYVLARIGSSLFYNARPFVSDHVKPLLTHAADNGFPSDHTLLAAVLAAALFAVSWRWGIGFLVAAIIIGGSRVLAHVHHPIDIIGSLVFAAIGGVVAFYLTPKITKLLSSRRAQ